MTKKELIFRPMESRDTLLVYPLMQEFYDKCFGAGNYADELLWRNIDRCVDAYPHVKGWVITDGTVIMGYAMVSFGYDPASGKEYLRVEELYVAPVYRTEDPGSAFLKALPGLCGEALYVAIPAESRRAMETYQRCGYRRETLLLST